ncbi:hypothetical protein IKQ21_01200 [bacterium]|nr:hypothetical protein [bacterium]
MTKKQKKEAVPQYALPAIMLKGTSAGRPLRKLGSLTCPYTGVKGIPGDKINPFERKLQECDFAAEYINLLSNYMKNMLPTEKSVFSIFRDFSVENPRGNLQDCLNFLFRGCLTKLKLEEFFVLDEVDVMSRKLSPETALKLREKTTRCRQIILADNKDDTFKRKTFLNSLSEISPKENEKDIFENIKNRAIFLPTSGSSRNAFVVKYSRRTQREAARRIFIASTETIEHVTPNSEGGRNEIGNFMLTTANGNRYRENMPLDRYVQRFPRIPKYTQQYINEVIDGIHQGRMCGHELYPYQIKQKLMEESQGKIMISLSKYDYTEQGAKLAEQSYHSRTEQDWRGFNC